LVLPGLRNSAFTHKLLEVLRQAAASGEIVATSLLGAQLKTSVPDLILSRTNGKLKQTPQFGSRGTEGEWLFVPMTATKATAGVTPETTPAVAGALLTSIRLELTGVPAGAKVTVDGAQLTGNVFTDDIVEKAKTIEIAVVATGFKPYVYSVVIPRGGNVVHAVTLEAKPKPANRLTDYPALRAYVESLRSISAGTFQMGSTQYSDEKPVHGVTLSAFRMGATPVTVAVWKEYCVATGTVLPNDPGWGLLDDHPVVNVSWNDIMGSDGKGGFCAWASDIAGFRRTLPTEAQWEDDARGGVDGQEFPWGNSFDLSKLWCSSKSLGDAGKTAPVNRTSNIYRNAFGLTDMVGNVWQWCSDLYGPYSTGSQTDPVGPSSTSDNKRCVRGGSWDFNYPDGFRCAIRDGLIPDFRYSGLGFRLSAGPS
jgi:formylglycine-generating enzyme required for sulfatase activity